jgi:hypothetical protein
VLWLTGDWTGAWVGFAAPFLVLALGPVLRRGPRSSRLADLGLWFAYVGCGVTLSLGIPNRTYQGLGLAILVWAAVDLWRRYGDRVKPLFYRLFGGPDPPQTDPVRVFTPGSRLAAIAEALSPDAGKRAREPKDPPAHNTG